MQLENLFLRSIRGRAGQGSGKIIVLFCMLCVIECVLWKSHEEGETERELWGRWMGTMLGEGLERPFERYINWVEEDLIQAAAHAENEQTKRKNFRKKKAGKKWVKKLAQGKFVWLVHLRFDGGYLLFLIVGCC